MTETEKLAAFTVAIEPDTENESVLLGVLRDAEALILNKMYPFGYPEDAVIPSRYERLQIMLAVELFSKRGAEGQTTHSENGIARTWPEKNRLLAQVMPRCGSVITDA